MQYIINGGKKLHGVVRISGNKNAIFPCIAASFLTKEKVVLENISQLKDTDVLIQILKKMGVDVKEDKDTLEIIARDIKQVTLPKDLMTKLRGSMLLVGAMLARRGKVHFYHPGGDVIGQRSITTHLEAFKKMGAKFSRNNLKFTLQFPENSMKESISIFLSEASVTATENLILAASLGNKTLTIKNCSIEPHVLDLCNLLIQMGAKISGIGTSTLVIEGEKSLHGTMFKIGIDYIEVGTYVIAAAITGGSVKIEGIDSLDLDPVLSPIKNFGVQIEQMGESIVVSESKLRSCAKLTTNIWPGFPTDLMSAAVVLATQSRGMSLCHDWMYEGRMFFVDKLISMGAKIILADPHRVLVYGPNKLHGKTLDTPDIRAGMALILAALVAKGKSTINQADLIERGYEDVVGKLRRLGAQIERVEL